VKTSSFGHEVMEGVLAVLALPVDSSREEEEGGEPKRRTQGNEDNNQRFWKLNSVHLVLGFLFLEMKVGCETFRRVSKTMDGNLAGQVNTEVRPASFRATTAFCSLYLLHNLPQAK